MSHLRFYISILLLLFIGELWSQCSGGLSSGVFNDASTSIVTVNPAHQGLYYWFGVEDGLEYSLSTCGTSYNTRMYARPYGSSTMEFDYDDVGGTYCFTTSNEYTTWSSDFTGYIGLAAHYYQCSVWNSTSAVLKYRQTSYHTPTFSTTDMCSGDTRELTADVFYTTNSMTWEIAITDAAYAEIVGTTLTTKGTSNQTIEILGILGADTSHTFIDVKYFYDFSGSSYYQPLEDDTMCSDSRGLYIFGSLAQTFRWDYQDGLGNWNEISDGGNAMGFSFDFHLDTVPSYRLFIKNDSAAIGDYLFRVFTHPGIVLSDSIEYAACYIADTFNISVINAPEVSGHFIEDSVCSSGLASFQIDSVVPSYTIDKVSGIFPEGAFSTNVIFTHTDTTHFDVEFPYLFETQTSIPVDISYYIGSCKVSYEDADSVYNIPSGVDIILDESCEGSNTGVIHLPISEYTFGTIDSIKHIQWVLGVGYPEIASFNDTSFTISDTLIADDYASYTFFNDSSNHCYYFVFETFTVHPQLSSVVITDSLMDCIGDTLTFSATSYSSNSIDTFLNWETANSSSGPWTSTGNTLDSIQHYTINPDTYYRLQYCSGLQGCDTIYSNVSAANADNIKPDLICNNHYVYLDLSGQASINYLDVTSYLFDSCGIDSIYLSQDTFTCVDLGPNTISMEVFDEVGNGTFCNPIVYVLEHQVDPPLGIAASDPSICYGSGTYLTIVPSPAPTTVYRWFEGSCGGAYIGSGSSILVAPNSTTDYYARAESPCGTVVTSCAGSFTVVVSGSPTVSPTDILPTTAGVYASTCYVADTFWHYFYHSSGVLLGGVRSTGIQTLGDVTFTVEVGNYGPFGTGYGPGVCGNTGVENGEYALPRNWDISITGSNPTAHPVEVVFFYEATEVGDLSSTISGLSYYSDYIQCWGDVLVEADLMMTVQHSGGTAELFTSLTPSTGPNVAIRQIQFSLGEFSQGFLHAKGGASHLSNNALPVSLVDFSAIAINDNDVQVNWETLTEINNDGFELYRSSNGIDFTFLTWVEGNGNSNKHHKYEYLDRELQSGTYYYKLKQIDFNGDSETFSIITVRIDAKETWQVGEVYPNPTKGELNIPIQLQNNQQVELSLFNTLGQRKRYEVLKLKYGEQVVKWNMDGFASGLYLLRIISTFGVQERQVIISY